MTSTRAAAPRLYLVTDRRATNGRPLVDVVRAALEGAGGLAPSVAVQLREKDLPVRELVVVARALRETTSRFSASLYVNDRVDVALSVGADGVHLGGGALPVGTVRSIAPGLRIAVSTHAPREVAAARQAGADFVVFGPVFDTPSKRAYGVPVGLPALAAAASLGIPVVALGGITPDNTAACLARGAAGVACIRALLEAQSPAAAAGEFLAHFARNSAAPD